MLLVVADVMAQGIVQLFCSHIAMDYVRRSYVNCAGARLIYEMAGCM
jgi:hypothetical protein